MRITTRGRVTIPLQIRQELGLMPGDDVDVVVRDGLATIVPAARRATSSWDIVTERLARGEATLSTDEIMALMHEG